MFFNLLSTQYIGGGLESKVLNDEKFRLNFIHLVLKKLRQTGANKGITRGTGEECYLNQALV